MASIEQLLSVLEDTAELLKKTQTNLKKSPKSRLTKGHVQSRLQCVEDHWINYKKTYQDLVKNTKKEQRALLPYFVNEEFYIHEDLYICLVGDLKDMLASVDSAAEERSRSQEVFKEGGLSCTQAKLPRIQIPTFSGNYEEWPAFKDMYCSLVHNDTSLSNVQKLHYLKTSITGEAAALLKHIQLTDSNYTQAWTTLSERYGNKRLIVNSLLKRLFAQKKCPTQTASHLKSLLDTTNEVMNSLKNLNVLTDSWDPIIIFLVVQKLDAESHKEWEQFAYTNSGEELSKWDELKKFLESRFRTIELVIPPPSTKEKTVKERVLHMSTSEKTCSMCKENHTLCHCKVFTTMEPCERTQYINNNKLCYNCLAPGHSAFKCRMRMSCRICKKRHHTLLHQSRKPDESTSTKEPIQSTSSTQLDVEEKQVHTTIASHQQDEDKKVCLLATAVVILKGEHGQTTVLKALIDSGSQACFISEKAAQALKLERKPVNIIVTGMESMKVQVRQEVKVQVLSRWESNFELPIRAYVMSKRLTTNIPSDIKPVTNWPHLQNLDLADPNYYKSGTMDLLLGVEEYTTILQQGLIKGPLGSPCAQRTNLGWIIMGGTMMTLITREQSLSVISNEEANIEDLLKTILVLSSSHEEETHLNSGIPKRVETNELKTIWEIDSDVKRNLTRDEQLCEDLYERTHTRDETGRYIVKLPFNTEEPKSTDGGTREIALRRLLQLERKFNKNFKLKEEYTRVIEEYIKLNHMEEVPAEEREKKAVYLPHHAVLRDDKETTKTRVVFDASCKGSNGVSLNDELLTGPTLQEDLRSLIVRWRTHPICYVTDIVKMYRMIRAHKEDVDFLRILWRSSPSDPVKDYRLLTVTFGTASAPYLAVKTLMQLAIDEGDKYAEAARVLREDGFVDDYMSGCDTLPEAIKVTKELKKLLSLGGFTLQKWSSNNAEFMQSLQPSERSTNAHLELKVDGIVKALGIHWNLGSDQFEYNLNLPPASGLITKRSILSDIQKLFDPLGWIAPCILMAKILIQRLWLEKVNWDEEINTALKEEWMNIRDDLTNVNDIQIDRWLNTFKSTKQAIQIHGFSDASMHAYAAVVYCRVTNPDGTFKITLIAARTRVAPLKTISLPRLELCGALLLSRLLKHVAQAMRISASQIFAWTDSTIVLSWLFGDPARWKPFVANRVVEITSAVNSTQWHHVQSQDNPADVASRGMSVKDLKKCDLWWRGPEWLSRENIEFLRPNIMPTDLEEKKKNIIQTLITTEGSEEIEEKIVNQFDKFDTLKELLRAITYCRKFLHKKKGEDLNDQITTRELDEALTICIKLAQGQDFSEEIEAIRRTKQVKKTSKIKSLDPYLDEKGILRVGGRLRQAHFLNSEERHPIILGKGTKLTSLIVADAHMKTLHGGTQLVLCHLRSKYWIMRAKAIVKLHIHRCLICAKQRAKPRSQLMGDLPSVRVTPARPFLNAGVDFAGPFHILLKRGRGAHTTKAYVAIFICMATKAIHLELVGDLTTAAFIGAFRRFCARRGRCANLWSDQGRNFIGANKELVDSWKEARLQFDGEICDTLASDGTQWHFIPAYSPNFGGLWEAGVKSMKYHLKRILNTNLTAEEMTTVLCEIEACLNSRPLYPINHADEIIQPLTPGHFLIGEAPITVPSPDFKDVKMSRLTRWQYAQKLLTDFWCRWQQEYLSRLQQRPKWLKRSEEFKEGDIVLIKQDHLPPGKWALGRIVEKHPGPDGFSRVYSVRSGENIVKRSISKLCALPIESD